MDRFCPIEDLIPHRSTMLLIDTIVSIDQQHAVAQATVKDTWPMVTRGSVNPLIFIELAAQTAGVCFGWHELSKPLENRGEAGGWLVGVKSARFQTAPVAVATCLTIRSQNRLIVAQYKEIEASVCIHDRPVAEIHLQVLQAGKSGF